VEQVKPEGIKKLQFVFLLSLVLILPGLQWPVFSWVCGFVPFFSFYILCTFGWNKGNIIILQSTIFSCLVCYFLKMLPLVLLTLLALPSGYIMAYAAGRSESQVYTGLKGILVLGFCWLIFWKVLGATSETLSYSNLIHWLQEGLDVSLNVYRQNQNIPVDTLVVVDQMLNQMKVVLPKILPAILASIVICSIWFAMFAGNQLLLRHYGKSPWPDYKFWKLPEKLIWAEIASASLALIPAEPIRTLGINVLFLVSIFFVFQGISILVYFFNKWNMSVIFRWLLYVIAIIQSSGTILLLAIGVADVWFDFRRLNNDADIRKNEKFI
jgi:uncharacterized protein YybS (DUF2232 family)